MSRISIAVFVACALVLSAAPAYADQTPGPHPSYSTSPDPTDSASPNASASASASASPSLSPSPTQSLTPLQHAKKVVQSVGDKAPGGTSFSGRKRLMDLVASLDSQIATVAAQVSQLAMKTARAQAVLASVVADEQRARIRVEAQRTVLRKNAANFYMTGAWESTMPVFNSDDITDVATARVYMTGVLDTASTAIAKYRADVARLEASRARTDALKSDLQSQIAEHQQELTTLGQLRAEKQALLGGVVTSFGTGSSAIGSLIDAAQDGQSVANLVGQYVLAPVDGPITSPFGWRIHPIFGYRSFHTGVDIGAGLGSPIKAARAGVVLASGLVGPFGLATVIDDGRRIATVYAHQSTSLVKEGQRVQAGQVIGFVGCSGWCTGPHLHFEVWFGGRPTDPVPWLAGLTGAKPRAS